MFLQNIHGRSNMNMILAACCLHAAHVTCFVTRHVGWFTPSPLTAVLGKYCSGPRDIVMRARGAHKGARPQTSNTRARKQVLTRQKESQRATATDC